MPNSDQQEKKLELHFLLSLVLWIVEYDDHDDLPKSLIVSLQHGGGLCEYLGHTHGTDLAFCMAWHLLQVPQEQAFHHHCKQSVAHKTLCNLFCGMEDYALHNKT